MKKKYNKIAKRMRTVDCCTHLIVGIQTFVDLDLCLIDDIIDKLRHLVHVLWILSEFGDSCIERNMIWAGQVQAHLAYSQIRVSHFVVCVHLNFVQKQNEKRAERQLFVCDCSGSQPIDGNSIPIHFKHHFLSNVTFIDQTASNRILYFICILKSGLFHFVR